MKITITKYEDHSEVAIRDNSNINLHSYVFDTHDEAKSFFQGFKCCQTVINSLVQSLPLSYELITKN